MPPEKKKSGSRCFFGHWRVSAGQRRGSVLVLDQLEQIDGVPGIVDLVEYFFSGEKPVERLTHGQRLSPRAERVLAIPRDEDELAIPRDCGAPIGNMRVLLVRVISHALPP